MQYHRNNVVHVQNTHDTIPRLVGTQYHRCGCCSVDASGNLLDPARYHRICGYAGQVGHTGGRFHQHRLNRLPAGTPMWQPGVLEITTIHRCNHCCLTPEGHTRDRALSILDASLVEHVAGAEHVRRSTDGRMALYVGPHAPGQHQPIQGDEW